MERRATAHSPRDYPTSFTREQRLEVADLIGAKLRARHGEALLAVGLFGSVARGEDGPYSDLEILGVVAGQQVRMASDGIFRGLRYEVSVVSSDTALMDIGRVNLAWPYAVGKYLDFKVLIGDTSLPQVFHAEYAAVREQDFRPHIRDVFVKQIYEHSCKFLNTARGSSPELTRYMTLHLFGMMVGFLGLANKSYFGGAASRARQALALPINFPSFRELGERIYQGDLVDVGALEDLAEAMLQEVLRYLRDEGISFDSDEIVI